MEHVKIHRIIRSKRRTVALMISPDATLTVRAPMRLPLYFIEQLVSKKSLWIRRIIKNIQARPKVEPKEFVDGEEFLYFGETFRLKIVDDAGISLGEELCFPKSMLCDASKNLMDWYKKEAKQKIEELVVCRARQMGVEYKSIAITGAEKRWGSCTRKSGLNFSWRLAMAPLEVIDYVVVHELSHLREMNHSARFWRHVNTLFPDPSTQTPPMGGGLCSGFRLKGGKKGTAGMPAGLHYKKHVKWLRANDYLMHIRNRYLVPNRGL